MLKISSKIEEKLKCKHNITVDEVKEAIGNAKGRPIEDTAEDHKTNPPLIGLFHKPIREER